MEQVYIQTMSRHLSKFFLLTVTPYFLYAVVVMKLSIDDKNTAQLLNVCFYSILYLSCATKQFLCETVCFNQFMPINLNRYWQWQTLRLR